VVGAVLILIVLFVAGPIGLFFGGAALSALIGLLESDSADARSGDS
jgi:hypothetical protein